MKCRRIEGTILSYPTADKNHSVGTWCFFEPVALYLGLLDSNHHGVRPSQMLDPGFTEPRLS